MASTSGGLRERRAEASAKIVQPAGFRGYPSLREDEASSLPRSEAVGATQAAATVASQGGTGNPYIDGVLTGVKWDGGLTFSFPQSKKDYPSGYSSEPSRNFAPVSTAQMNATRAALTGTTVKGGDDFLIYNPVTAFTNLSIQEAGGAGKGLNGSGDIRLAESSVPGTAYAYYPSDDAAGMGGDIWFGTAYAGTIYDYRTPAIGNYAYYTGIHELGHALGLKHSQEMGGPSNVAVPSDRDDIEFSVMSYRSYIGGSTDGLTIEEFGAPQSYMMVDIQALQTMYGADYSAHASDTTYRWDKSTGEMSVRDGASGSFVAQGKPGANRVFLTTWDGGGNDTYDMSNYTTAVSIDLRPGQWSITSDAQRAYLGDGHLAQGNVYNAYLFEDNPASLIENAIGGTDADTLLGNQADNVLTGGLGADLLTGGDGADIFQDTGVDLNGDTITDFSTLDMIRVTDAISAVYGLRYSGTSLSFKLAENAKQTYTITITGGTFTGTFLQRADTAGGVDIYVSPTSVATPTVTLAPASDTGVSSSDGLTKLTVVSVAGTATGGDVVTIFDDANGNGVQDAAETALASVSVAKGASTYTATVTLTEGAHALRAYQRDPTTAATSKVSAAAVVTVDTTLPGVAVSVSDKQLSAGETALVTLAFSEAVTGVAASDLSAAHGSFSQFKIVDARTATAVYTPQSGFTGTDTITVGTGLYGDLAGNNGTSGAVTVSVDAQPDHPIILGTPGNDTLVGTPGADTIDGGAGADKMTGGAGDDTYVVDDAGDRVIEKSKGGIDTVETSLATYTLGSEVENLTYTGTGSFAGTGNKLANALTGGTGNDTLDGQAGADTMTGGAGDDTYVVDDAGDVVVEQSGGGTDTVRAGVSYALGANVEALVLTGTSSINATGNALANTITGNRGKNVLDGGPGADTLSGGAGDDTYVVDDVGDQVIELAKGGTDMVRTTLSLYTLGDEVENLTYTGTGSFTGTGNALANILTGGAGNDRLDGRAGGDKMAGGLGDDTYVVDTTKDSVKESSNAGTDTVETSLSKYTLGTNLENLTYTGSGGFTGTGNAATNALTGGTGSDVLDGRGGADLLTGGGGNDTYVLRKGEANGDVVLDFTGAGAAVGDQLRLLGYGAGMLTHGSTADSYVITPDAKHGGAAAAETIRLVGVTDLDLAQGTGHNDYVFA